MCTYMKGKRGLVLVCSFPVFNLAVLTNSSLYMAMLLPFKEIGLYMYNTVTCRDIHDYVQYMYITCTCDDTCVCTIHNM